MYYKIISIGKFGLPNKLVVWEIKIALACANKHEAESRKMNAWSTTTTADTAEINMQQASQSLKTSDVSN